MKRLLVLSALVMGLFLPKSVFGGNNSYRSDCLVRIGEILGAEQLAALPDGEYPSLFCHHGYPVTVTKQNDEIVHIGYRFFSREAKDALGHLLCNFLERYALEADLPFPREKTVDVQLLEDGMTFLSGNLDSLKTLFQADADGLRIERIGSRRYRFCWSGGELLFPVDAELLTGRSQRENDRRLPAEIQFSSLTAPIPAPVSLTLREDGILVKEEDSYYLSSLSANTYYEKDGCTPVNDLLLENETLANLFSGLIADSEIRLRLKMCTYGLTHEYFEASMTALSAYALNNGCIPYVGVIAKDGEMAEVLVIYRNMEAGFNHVLRVQMPHEVLESGRGTVSARLTPFVPTHSIQYLFEEIKL